MKKLYLCVWALLMTAVSYASSFHKPNVIVGYVTSWSSVMPDPSLLTQINYAFAHVDSTFCGVTIANVDRLRSIVKLKETAPSLKVVLSIGGWQAGNFSEMAADEKYRKSFVGNCKRLVNSLNLDGIDIDWEYPTVGVAGISSSPDDTRNFTLLIKDLRRALGKRRVLTVASIAYGKFIDFAAIAKYVDYINIMAYDIDNPPHHQAPLFRSDMVGRLSCEEAVKAHLAFGVSPYKLVLGIPFYGRMLNEGAYRSYKELTLLNGYQRHWDEIAKVPYMTDSTGHYICSYEDVLSIRCKCAFIKQCGLRGAMYWEYGCDDENGTLRKAVYDNLFVSDSNMIP